MPILDRVSHLRSPSKLDPAPSCPWLKIVGIALAALAGLSSSAAPDVFDELALTPLTSAVSNQVAIVSAGDERLFLVDQDGFVWIWDGAQVLATPFLDLSALVSRTFEQGLLSLAFHPDYATNGYFFVYYSDLAADIVLARYEASAADPNQADATSAAILMTVPHFGGHYGSSLQFGPDGYLYFGIGDGGQQQDPACRAQNESLLQGKILRIDVDQNVSTPPFHGIPPSNPFVGPGDPPDEVWAIGFRNPWRLTFDRGTGDLFIADVGQNQREEVTVQPADSAGGENYGWKIMEGTFCFDPDPIDPDCPAGTLSCDDPSFVPPSIEYAHGAGDCSITGGHVYRGTDIPALTGFYLYGDWCSGRLWAARSIDDIWESTLLSISLAAITSFGEDAAGEIYLTNGSTLFRIDGPAALFADGFEDGDFGAWSMTVP
ncbi:MAG: PQQ-dependent sugar dehydrogenase [Acidobacteriota bacterium]